MTTPTTSSATIVRRVWNDRKESRQPMKLESQDWEKTIAELGKLVDLLGYRTYIAEQTYGGREPGTTPWEITREYMRDHANPANSDRLIALLESAGCRTDIEAALWICEKIGRGSSPGS